MRIVILDACRENPFASQMRTSNGTRSVTRGLARVEPSSDTLVVYAAKAGALAADGEGRNSPFAAALARRLPEPGLEISLLFRKVRDDVLAATNRAQEPFTYGSLSGTEFYFRPANISPLRPDRIINGAPRQEFQGTWEGTYRYNSGSNPMVRFAMTASLQDGRIVGSINEPNTFGNNTSSFLYARIEGTISGTTARLVKTYDGTAGQSHAVIYEGVFDPATKSIIGGWRIGSDGQVMGRFDMRLRN